MKYVIQFAIAAVLTGLTAGVFAADTTGTPPPHAGWHQSHAGVMAGGVLLRAMHQLNLTDAQQQQIKDILQNARTELRSQHQGAPDIAVLGNPGDPNYAAAVQTQQSRASERVEYASQVEQQIYGVLTDEQKAQLPQILTNLKSQRAQQHAAAQTG